jgi:hypothetical protein
MIIDWVPLDGGGNFGLVKASPQAIQAVTFDLDSGFESAARMKRGFYPIFPISFNFLTIESLSQNPMWR